MGTGTEEVIASIMLNTFKTSGDMVKIGYIHPTHKLTCTGHYMGWPPFTTATITVIHSEYNSVWIIPSLTQALSHFVKALLLKITLFPGWLNIAL